MCQRFTLQSLCLLRWTRSYVASQRPAAISGSTDLYFRARPKNPGTFTKTGRMLNIVRTDMFLACHQRRSPFLHFYLSLCLSNNMCLEKYNQYIFVQLQIESWSSIVILQMFSTMNHGYPRRQERPGWGGWNDGRDGVKRNRASIDASKRLKTSFTNWMKMGLKTVTTRAASMKFTQTQCAEKLSRLQ